MTEQEYIDATNLAKVRAAKNVLRDYFPWPEDGPDQRDWHTAMRAMRRLEERLEKLVKTESSA
jgi:hypothetical protein